LRSNVNPIMRTSVDFLLRLPPFSPSLTFCRLGVCLSFVCILPQAEGNTVFPVWNAFAGQETLVIRETKDRVPSGESIWFRVAKGTRTMASGSARSGQDGRLELPVRLPNMKPGVALPFEVELRAGSDKGRLLRSGTLWVFSEQPFDPEFTRAGSRALLLYDPEGHTRDALRSISIAFENIEKPGSLDAVTNSVIVVGESVSLESERGLSELLCLAVTRGNRVLLLAPRAGQLKLPSAWRILLAGNAQDVLRTAGVKTAPYKLNLNEWPPDGRVVQMRFRLTADHDDPVFAMTPDTGCEAIGWDDVASGGRLRACGLGIAAKWHETPAARWLLAEMVERLANEE